ncbi:Alkaline phosphatase, tissue-nonspecific isozyme [Araneus ventricosus]|uniref:alkaline phosphatase n=1 Tax=Araneus ventricosus TaxID=182803 RepID=A0A4Y2D9J7_ARAVE|nr:Alkaline phosphatase, tissue-nonspecific isozyme [Araneus ventricosus]
MRSYASWSRGDNEHLPLVPNRWYWYQQAKSTLLKNLDDDRNYNVAKNLILFIGDGMGMTTVTTARILRGQKAGHTGEENELAFDKFEYVALAKDGTDIVTEKKFGLTKFLTNVSSLLKEYVFRPMKIASSKKNYPKTKAIAMPYHTVTGTGDT